MTNPSDSHFPTQQPSAAPQPARPERDWLAALLLRRPEGFLNRLALGAGRWRALSRATRRRVQRRVALSAAGAALILAMAGSPLLVPPVHAAAITVGGTCSLVDAIKSANSDTSYGTCTSGSGADTITLTGDVTLTASVGYYYLSDTGLPRITTEIIIDGDGFTIERDGAAPDFRLMAVSATGDLTLHDVTLSGGSAEWDGGAVCNDGGALTLTQATISDNDAYVYGGGIYSRGGTATLTITNSLISGNTADWGGGLYNNYGVLTVTDSTIRDNTAVTSGGGVLSFYGTATIRSSTITGNDASYGGGVYNDNFSEMTITNSTISGNEASDDGGGLYTDHYATTTVTNSTITGNTAGGRGGGVYGWNLSTTILIHSIVSGNSAASGDEVGRDPDGGTITADAYNLFGHSGISFADAFYNFSPGVSDFVATSDNPGAATHVPTPLTGTLDTTLADNGGPTLTHNLVLGSPAIDKAPNATCAAPPVNGVDQRGEPRPFDSTPPPTANDCDAGAVEYGSPVPGEAAVFVSTTAAGTTSDGLAFGPEDIILWDGTAWSTWFDGSAAGLMPTGNAKHDINAFAIPDTGGEDVLLSFAQNARAVPGIPGKVDGMDVVRWDGVIFQLAFDGSDVGLTNMTQEKIDALHLLDGADAPPELIAAAGGSCQAYMLVSTSGPGKVPHYSGGTLSFSGEDVLGFCFTSNGQNTAGKWIKVLDGSDHGMPKNSTDSISLSDDGETLYFTTKGTFNVDDAVGGHSMVYVYDVSTEEFDGPFFIAADHGLPKKVDGLQVEGSLVE